MLDNNRDSNADNGHRNIVAVIVIAIVLVITIMAPLRLPQEPPRPWPGRCGAAQPGHPEPGPRPRDPWVLPRKPRAPMAYSMISMVPS